MSTTVNSQKDKIMCSVPPGAPLKNQSNINQVENLVSEDTISQDSLDRKMDKEKDKLIKEQQEVKAKEWEK